VLRPDNHEVEAFFPNSDRWVKRAEPDPPDRAGVIAAARAQRLEEPGLAVDDETLERVADTVMDADYGLPGLYYTADELADDVPAEIRDRVVDYVDRDPDMNGGLRLGWRDGRRVMFVAVVKDIELHRSALADLCGDRVIVESVPRSERELLALQERISADGEVLRALGIDQSGSSFDPSLGVVELSIVAADGEQAQRTLSARYGPAVRVASCTPSWTAEATRAFGSWSTERHVLVVFYPLDRNGEQPERCEVVEMTDSVRCTVIIREPAVGVARTLIGGYRAMSAEVVLREPLGTRTVIDGSCGEPRQSLAQLRNPLERP
jgi:hypothetical protein